MKTLLLTLVVVTIVCLDLGNTANTLMCDNSNVQSIRTPKRCLKNQKLCYKITFFTPGYGWTQKKGCIHRCPESTPDKKVQCCATNNCI
uniref:Three-finger toxin 11a n=1 Tax=Micrurus fulvius TaxID=8637 RepID=A0A0F7Z3S7_MICFL